MMILKQAGQEPLGEGFATVPETKPGFAAYRAGPIITVKSLWKVFGKSADLALSPDHAGKSKDRIIAELGSVLALQDVSFAVDRGETFVVMGLSGSGKSTLIRCLIRLIEPTSGEIQIGGEDILKYDEKGLIGLRRDKIAMVFQHYGLLPHRQVIDNAAWGLEVRGVDKATRYARTREVLELVGLKGWRRPIPGSSAAACGSGSVWPEPWRWTRTSC